MRAAYSSLIVITLALLVGCSGRNKSTDDADAQIRASAEEIEALKETVSQLRMDSFFLASRVEALESGKATVSTEGEGYDVARTRLGPLTVSASGVSPYLDGFKVKLTVGNLTNADFIGAKVTVGWGPPYDGEDSEEWQKKQKKKEMAVTAQFSSGSFTDIEAILTPAQPEDIKSITVGFELSQIALRVK